MERTDGGSQEGRRRRRRRGRRRRGDRDGRPAPAQLPTPQSRQDAWRALGETWQRLGLQLAQLGCEDGVAGLRATAAALSSFAEELHWHVGGVRGATAGAPAAGDCERAPADSSGTAVPLSSAARTP